MRNARPVLCVLLAVSTAIGTAPAVMACPCPPSMPARPASAPERAAPCCTVDSRCAGAACCIRTDGPGGRAGSAACGCPVCGTPDTPQPAVPTVPAADELEAQSLPPAVPLFLLPPVTAGRVSRPAFTADLPPPDLVTLLCCLTC